MSGSPIVLPRPLARIDAGDFNGTDGSTRVTSTDSNSHGYVNVLLGVPGGFVAAPGSHGSGKRRGVRSGDFNHDGWADLASS